MLTKTKIIQKEKNDLETNHYFSISYKAQKNIDEKGFYLYNWIGEQDVKQSIERDFLKYINLFGGSIIFIYLGTTLILGYIGLEYILIVFFYSFPILLTLILIIFLIYISIKRTLLLINNKYLLVTQSHISINGNITKLSTLNKKSYSIKKIEKIFEENIFEESKISKSKGKLILEAIEKIKDGYYYIFSLLKKDLKNISLIPVLIIFYTIYIAFISSIYFVGISIIWFFGLLLSFINKKILLLTGHQITKINNNFENIDNDSKELIKEKNNLSKLLIDAMESDWKDSLLLKINSGIKNINNNASNAIDTSIELKERIEKSKYKEMFNFSIYNSWIKKQIYTPLKQILDLLELNLDKLKIHKANIEKQILETQDVSLKGPLVLTKNRTEMSIKDIEKHIIGMNIYINKLK